MNNSYYQKSVLNTSWIVRVIHNKGCKIIVPCKSGVENRESEAAAVTANTDDEKEYKTHQTKTNNR